MSYRDLIDGAARAIGSEVHWEGSTPWLGDSYQSPLNTRPWDPINNDHHALYIACALSMDIRINQITVVASLGDVSHTQECLGDPKDRLGAFRLAVVNCAALSSPPPVPVDTEHEEYCWP